MLPVHCKEPRINVPWRHERNEPETQKMEPVSNSKMAERRERETISLAIDVEMRERIERLAREQDRTLSAQVRHLLSRALEPQRERVAA